MENENIINKIGTITDVANMWNEGLEEGEGINRGTLVQVVRRKGGRFVEGVDWRLSGNTVIMTLESMERVYGEPGNPKRLKVGLTEKSFEDELGMKRLGSRRVRLGDCFEVNNSMDRVVYEHAEHGVVARLQSVWFKLDEKNYMDTYILEDDKLYENGHPEESDLEVLRKRYKLI